MIKFSGWRNQWDHWDEDYAPEKHWEEAKQVWVRTEEDTLKGAKRPLCMSVPMSVCLDIHVSVITCVNIKTKVHEIHKWPTRTVIKMNIIFFLCLPIFFIWKYNIIIDIVKYFFKMIIFDYFILKMKMFNVNYNIVCWTNSLISRYYIINYII